MGRTMFENLTDNLKTAFRRLGSKGKVTEGDLRRGLKEIRTALLDADVSYSVVKQFTKRVQEKALGAQVLKGLNPAQQLLKITHEELVHLLGDSNVPIKQRPTVVMLCGLQGSGKTTTAGKLGRRAAQDGLKPLLVATDVYRPAAIHQLQVVGEQAQIDVFTMGENDPVDIARAAVKHGKSAAFDIVIIDTAGRLHIDEQMMEEARSFILRNGVVSLPGASLPLVLGRPVSPGGPLVSLTTPGVLGDTESSVSLGVGVPGFGESAEIAERLDRRYRAGGIELLTLRGSFPGALVHWLHLRTVSSPLRKTLLHPSFSEGWALYAEEMILDRGLGGESPALRLRQLHSSLFELALSRVGILLHQGEMSPIDAAAYLADVAFVDDDTALLGAREVTLDPLRGATSLIKAGIREFGQEFQEHLVERGVTFSTQDFHDRLLSEGLPLSLAREVMIGTEQD